MDKQLVGWSNGLLGVLIFSASLPATRVAVLEFSPIYLTAVRAVIAALLGLLFLSLMRQARPQRNDLTSLIIVSVGVVVGFPLMTALALQHMDAAHSVVFIGLLPLATAAFGVLRGGEKPSPKFWLFSMLGSLLVCGFALSQDGSGSLTGDLLMIAAILLCGLGYAEGATLSRRLGGWQVISWALALSLPIMATIMLFSWPGTLTGISTQAWIGLGYVSVFSMLIGFIFWYRGLALGGIAGVGQLQLLQPFFGLLLAGLLLGEPIAWSMITITILVVACVAGARRYS